MLTPLQAIRQKCLDCCCGYSREVARCPFETCSLYPFRSGKNPRRAGITNNGSFSSKTNGLPRDFSHEDVSEGKYTTKNKNAENGA